VSISFRNTSRSYGLVSQSFHWLVVALVLAQYTWAWRIASAEGLRARYELVTQHKTLGMTVLALALLRLAWRTFDRPPPLPATLPRWEARAARITHRLLYALLIALPLSGWLYSSAAGLGDHWWGPVRFPSPLPASEPLEDALGLVHRTFGIALGLVAGLHVLAALRHHFLLGDDILRRMLPRWRER
jgi:cytochrome b561